MSTMVTREYTIRFLTPAFLGDANQDGAWRTPPFKALLRQWWRVAVAADARYDVAEIRRREGELFGVAADGEGDSRKSQVRIRLSRWDSGTLKSWNGLDTQRVTHPEVGRPVGAHLYLGYGPLEFRQGGTALKKTAAIQSGEEAGFFLAFPSDHAPDFDSALWLMERYGALGGRSRNGWGSIALAPASQTPPLTGALNSSVVRDWAQALNLDWPHALGTANGQPLIWQTAAMADWRAVMKRLAEIKIGLRTQKPFAFPNVAPPHPNPLPRHWLSYPITRHTTRAWDRNARLPNSLRFKVRADLDGKLRGVIFHVPCAPPPLFRPDATALRSVWSTVHAFLDAPAQGMNRIAA